MDKTILKNFAIDARNKLIQEITNKASLIGVTEKEIESPLPESTDDMLLFDIKAVDPYIINDEEVKQYNKLKEELKRREENGGYATAFSTLIEEVAYTWFNRLIAIRFMEVNNYLPDRMRILSSGREGVNEPEFVTNYRDTSLNFTDKELKQIMDWKMDGSNQSMEKIFHILFIKQCNALNENLPELFEKTHDYAELLLTISYNDPEGVLYKLVHDIPEEYFDVETDDGNGQVEIIGWMYQYYNSERKDEVFARPRSQKIPKEDIPAVTQLFTPDWIVRYMVENSLGRIWIEKLLASGEERNEKTIAEDYGWKYYIPEAGQDDDVKEQLIEIRNDRKGLKLEDIKFIDPAMGSFHIGVYAFDVFMQLYESQGYTSRDAANLIIGNNLYGIDIDKRAYQLSYFACMMKGRQYNRRILNGEVKTNLYTIVESNDINRNHLNYLGNNIKDAKEWNKAKEDIIEILDIFIDAKEYGSILKIEKKFVFHILREFILNTKDNIQVSFDTVGIEETQKQIFEILNMAEVLDSKFEIVITNPPYMGSSGMNGKLSEYVKKNYQDAKSDLFAVFIEKCGKLLKPNGYQSMITQHAWMFLSSYEKLREKLMRHNIVNMAHLGARAFEEIGGEVVQTTAFVIAGLETVSYLGTYARLVDFGSQDEKEIAFLSGKCLYTSTTDIFRNVPGSPLAYWAEKNLLKSFEAGEPLGEMVTARVGIMTGDNNRFLKFWWQVSFSNSCTTCQSVADDKNSKYKWFPYNKGGGYRKWYGNNEYFINFRNNGYEIFEHAKKDNRNSQNYPDTYKFRESITWSVMSSGSISVRHSKSGTLFDIKGSSCFTNNEALLHYCLAFLNSAVSRSLLSFISPTLDFNAGYVRKLPLIHKNNYFSIGKITCQCVELSRIDWDSFETSWDFSTHPLLDRSKQENSLISIEESYNNWKQYANNSFVKLKENEEELNRIFIEVYGFEDELTPQVSDKDITITKIFDDKDEIYEDIKGNRNIRLKEDVTKSFISYGVGCIMGRYSLDVEGLAYAGGEWDESKYETFTPAKDNMILITDEEYFEDDIVNRFIEFVKVTFGEETLDGNLQFIADSLGGRGIPKEVIRNYFMNHFYKDHVKMYQKTPIYWLYDSSAGKTRRNSEDGFKALIYMHRYNEDTTGKVRIDYLHKLQRTYERTMDDLKYDIENNENPRKVAESEARFTKLTKQLKECKDYDEKIGHLAIARIPIDLDDGVKSNYEKIQTDEKGNNLNILAKI